MEWLKGAAKHATFYAARIPGFLSDDLSLEKQLQGHLNRFLTSVLPTPPTAQLNGCTRTMRP